MNKLPFLRLISIIHAIKCNKTTLDSEADASFEKLTELQDSLKNNPDENISAQIAAWKSTSPIATDQEIGQLLNKS